MKLVLGILLVYLVVVGLIFAFQRSLMYYPMRLSDDELQRVLRQLPGTPELLQPFGAVVLSPAAGVPVRGTAVLFHGNAGLALHRAVFAEAFLKRGLRLVLTEYPGYGTRAGKPTEAALVEDAWEQVAAIHARFPREPLWLVGESLGTGVVVQVAARLAVERRESEVASLVLLTPFASMRGVASRLMPLFPARWLIRDGFDSERHLAAYRGEVRLLIVADDEVVGAAQGRRLFEAARARGPARAVEVPHGGHNGWLPEMTEAQWDALLM